MGLTIKEEREVRIADLETAFEAISQASDENIFYRELAAIQNALDFLKRKD